MIFNCNFERVFEEKERKETEKTIHYYRFNNVMQSAFISIEMAYCLACMGIFLLIIYWNHEGQQKVILGKDDGYISDDGDDDITFSEKMDHMHFLREREKQAQILDSHLSAINTNSFSSIADGSIMSQRDSLGRKNKSETYLSNYQLHSMKKHQRTMKIDSVYYGPT